MSDEIPPHIDLSHIKILYLQNSLIDSNNALSHFQNLEVLILKNCDSSSGHTVVIPPTIKLFALLQGGGHTFNCEFAES